MATFMALALSTTITTYTVSGVTFTVLKQEEPKKVVFLVGGENADNQWWFDDLTLFSGHEDTLVIGVAQTSTIKDDLNVIINWVNRNYSFPSRSQWSFLGFSLGAYQTFSIALDYYHTVFGNYCAIGGGMATRLVVNPNINFIYVCYGEYDIDKNSAVFAVKKLRANGFITARNYRGEVFKNEGHTREEAQKGLTNFLDYLDSVGDLASFEWIAYNFIANGVRR